jgi:DNA primase
MGKHKISRAELRRAEAEARRLLNSPRFFNEFLTAVKKQGLVGEEKNALALLIVAVSRLLRRPLNVMVKGQSASGKNWLVTRVLSLMPPDAVREITSTSARAWNYSKDDFRHRVVYLQERD